MKNKKTYAVFGLGRYGYAVARELADNGMDVIAVDVNEETVAAASLNIPICKCADVTDPEVLEHLGIKNVDVVIIAMAENLEAAVLAATLCKEAGVTRVIVKCANEMHCKIMRRVGADEAVIPEQESGVRLASNLMSAGFIDMLSLSKDISVVEVDVKEEWSGKSLIELDLRNKYDINVVAIRRKNKVEISIDPKAPLDVSEKLIVIAHTAKLNGLTK
ncbi:MAG: TrkA family potassium uptake protein [Ruminococcaceae bacterium]|nr:TrkA family potassium uptake protein [Oscillospiraceae bacterium]